MPNALRSLLVAWAGLLAAAGARAQDPLAAAFKTPPGSARPRVWWHWMNANVTQHGIDEDFAWMKRVGVAGVQNFDGSLNTPRIVETPAPFMSDAWKAAIRHAVSRADSLGLEFTIASSPGWSETGGPWVTPEQAMKKLVWSETTVEGGRPAGRLTTPPSVSGPFQDIPAATPAAFAGAGARTLPSLYHDAAVIAYRIPEAERDAEPTVSASGAVDTRALTDGDRAKRVELPFGPDSLAWVQFAYAEPQTVRALTVVVAGVGRGGGAPSVARLQASDDGTTFRTIGELPRGGAPEQTVALPATTARYFRVVFRQPAQRPGAPGGFGGQQPPPRGVQLAELSLTSAAREPLRGQGRLVERRRHGDDGDAAGA